MKQKIEENFAALKQRYASLHQLFVQAANGHQWKETHSISLDLFTTASLLQALEQQLNYLKQQDEQKPADA